MEKGIEEGNRLIAEFMGVKHFTEFHGSLCEIDREDGSPWDYDPIAWLDYEKNWSLLMPVVEKINRLKGYDIIIYKTTVHVNDCMQILFETTATADKIIDAVWKAVIQFIQWYNSQTINKNK